MPTKLQLKVSDLQPYYYGQVVNSLGLPVIITGATIYCTMKDAKTGTVKINRQTAGIFITDGANGQFEYRWQAGNTDTIGKYNIEFEVNPGAGGKYTVPVGEEAVVNILAALDAQ
jgi:hypothetical protein